MTTHYHSLYWAHALALRGATGSIEALSRSIAGSRVDLNPHQVDAALFAIRSPLTREQVQKPSDEVGDGRSLLVMCGAFRVKSLNAFPNLTVKKIPKAVLNRCEWGQDDYSLENKNLPEKPTEEISKESPPDKKVRSREERRATVQPPTLFNLQKSDDV